MRRSRLLILTLAAASASIAGAALAQNPEQPADPGAGGLSQPLNLDLDAFRSRYTPGGLGLKPPGTTKNAIELPFGLNYSREAKSLVMPLNDKSEWDIGVNMNMNSSRSVEIAPSGQGLQPKLAPGVIINRKF